MPSVEAVERDVLVTLVLVLVLVEEVVFHGALFLLLLVKL